MRLRAPAGRDDPKPLVVAIILASTSLGLVVPVIRDAGEVETTFGQTVLAASSIAEFGTILLISRFFSTSASGSSGSGSEIVLLVGFTILVIAVGLAMLEAGRSRRVSQTLEKLQATSLTFVVVAARIGLELDVFNEAAGATLVAAGLLSVIVFPPIARWLLATATLPVRRPRSRATAMRPAMQAPPDPG